MAQPVVGMNQRPTIVGIPPNKFAAEADAKVLRNAMKGVNTDEKAIIKILTTRNNRQIQEIRNAYAKLFDGKDLVRTIKDETSGNFEKVCVTLLVTRADFDAKCLHEGMSGMGTDENILIDIICTRTSAELEEISRSYDRLFDKSLLAIVKSETSGDFEKLLTACLACKRQRDEMKGDEAAAKNDAETLFKAGEKKMGTDEKKFIEILTTRSFSQINLIANHYEKISKKTLIAAIQDEMSGSLEKGLTTIINYSRDPAGFWAAKLRDTMKGVGTDETKLIRIMVSRAEIDLKSIRDIFGDRYGKGKTLLDWIKSDTSGDFENILVSLALGNEQQ